MHLRKLYNLDFLKQIFVHVAALQFANTTTAICIKVIRPPALSSPLIIRPWEESPNFRLHSPFTSTGYQFCRMGGGLRTTPETRLKQRLSAYLIIHTSTKIETLYGTFPNLYEAESPFNINQQQKHASQWCTVNKTFFAADGF